MKRLAGFALGAFFMWIAFVVGREYGRADRVMERPPLTPRRIPPHPSWVQN